MGQIAITANGTGFKAHVLYGTGGGSPTPRIRTLSITSSGLISSSVAVTPSGVGATTVAPAALVAGHDGLWLVQRSTLTPTTTSTVFQLSVNSGVSVVDSFDIPIAIPANGRWSMVNVVAPEPATFLVLGAPLMALMRKRKK